MAVKLPSMVFKRNNGSFRWSKSMSKKANHWIRLTGTIFRFPSLDYIVPFIHLPVQEPSPFLIIFLLDHQFTSYGFFHKPATLLCGDHDVALPRSGPRVWTPSPFFFLFFFLHGLASAGSLPAKWWGGR